MRGRKEHKAVPSILFDNGRVACVTPNTACAVRATAAESMCCITWHSQVGLAVQEVHQFCD
jgi:hypothetical protein